MAEESISRYLTRYAKEHPQKPVLSCGAETLTRQELESRTNRLARDFARLGVADRVICTLGARGVVKTMKVMLIENDPADSDVTVHLQLAHASP